MFKIGVDESELVAGGVSLYKLIEHSETILKEIKMDASDNDPFSASLQAVTIRYKCPLSIAREVLNLPEPPFSHFIIPGAFVAGGAVVSWLRELDNTGDVDFYFHSERDRQYFKDFFVNILEPTEIKSNHSDFYRFSSDIIINSIYSKYYANPLDCISEFDLTPCMVAVDQEFLYFLPSSKSSLSGLYLSLGHLVNPVGTMRRIMKYTSRGFRVYDGTLVEIMKVFSADPDHYTKITPCSDSDISAVEALQKGKPV